MSTDLLKTHLPAGTRILKVKQIASLWAGYGSILRVSVRPLSRTDPTSYIVKSVAVPTAIDREDVGHVRKLTSYRVEGVFYEKPEFATAVIQADKDVTLPLPVFVKADDQSVAEEFSLFIIMSDLSQALPIEQGSLSLCLTKSALRWLAGFHAHFWGSEPVDGGDNERAIYSSGVWKQGGYWHLSTRLDEFKAIQNNKRWTPFKQAAEPIATLLRGKSSEASALPDHPGKRCFRTLLHGDPKAENILFAAEKPLNDAPPACGFYDFQYTGYGYGAVDVAYFLATSVDSNIVETRLDELLDFYYMELVKKLTLRGMTAQADEYTPAILRTHFGWALVDWVRFIAGWGTWGNARWAEKTAKEVLATMGFT
ncbi:hypothetical protein SpCBS45565_g05214 [Spizellomyces sp. 'palustris']|nr:hypothetical protein SpCBS45565_g05214 [Spizellomyces sp. 'palustris']